MKRYWWFVPALLLPWLVVGFDAIAQDNKSSKSSKLTWKKLVLDKNFRSEGVCVADVNKDGKLDIIAGDCWYEVPKDPAGEWKRHILRADRKFDLLVYSRSFGCFADDFNGDGYPDVIVIPFPGEPCYWYANPGPQGGKWTEHLLTTSACNETPIYIDLFKTGKKVLVMAWNPPGTDTMGEMCYFMPGKDPTQPWQRISISGPSAKGKMVPATQRFSHGLGHGDVNGDGRIDIICPQGWWEQPEKQNGQPWKFHPASISGPCADMYAFDIDGDGKADIISSSAHGCGFWWSQQKDLSTFLQRPLFLPPSEAAKLPKGLVLADDEKALFDAISKARNEQFRRAPFVAHPELCRMARDHAQRLAKTNAKEANIAGQYPGKVLVVNPKRFANGKDAKALRTFAMSLLPDNEKERDLVLPGFEIGVGAAKTDSGEIQYTLLLGDRNQFALPSQTHALNFVDLDGDGLKDLVTGRRWWAHGPRGDTDPGDPAYLYWFQAKRGKDGMTTFTPHMIDDDSGIGTQFAVEDVNGDGLPDIIVANKKGVHVFLQVR